MKPRTEQMHRRRAKLPSILEIDEDGVMVKEMADGWNHPRWSSDGDEPGVSLGDWPAEYDD